MIATVPNSMPAPVRSPMPATPPRWPLIDLARWLAIYAIVWLHTVRSDLLRPSTVLTRFAVPFFVAACVFLVFQGVWRKPQRTLVQYGWNRFLRIYLPFLAWSAVYLGFKAVKSRFLPDQPNDYAGVEILWTGSFYHLWFMPFILLVSLAAFPVAKMAYRRESLRWPFAMGSLAAGLALSVPAMTGVVPLNDHPYDYMLDALPALFWAMTAALAYGRKPDRPWGDFYRLHLDVLLFAGSMLWLVVFGRSTLMENMAGASLLLIALRPTDSPLLCRMAQFPALAYGIYFSHMLPIKICEAFGKKLGFSESWQLDVAIFLAAAVTATAIAWLLYQWRWTRWLVA